MQMFFSVIDETFCTGQVIRHELTASIKRQREKRKLREWVFFIVLVFQIFLCYENYMKTNVKHKTVPI